MTGPRTSRAKCGICNKVVNESSKALQCDLDCDQWYHIECLGVSLNEYLRLAESDEEWACDTCGLKKANNLLSGEIKNLNEMVLILQSDINEYKSLYEEMKKQNLSLSEMCLNKEEEIVRLKNELDNKLDASPIDKSTNLGRHNLTSTRPFVRTIDFNQFPPLRLSNRYSGLALDATDTGTGINGPLPAQPSSQSASRTVHRSNSSLSNVKRKPDRRLRPGPMDLPSGPNSRGTSDNIISLPTIKVHHFADSQGRNVYKEFLKDSRPNLNISSVVKPGAKFQDVLPENVDDLGKEDFLVIQAGSNDVCKNESKDILVTLRRKLGRLYGTNVIVLSIPHRHDLENWSCVNQLIQKTNSEMEKVCSLFPNCRFINISKIGARFHTAHGMHLNRLGKRYVSDQILQCIELLYVSNLKAMSPIPLKGSFLV